MALPFSLQDSSLLSGIEPLPLSSPTSYQNSPRSVSPSSVTHSPSSTPLRRAATSELTSQLYASLRHSQELQEEKTEEVFTDTKIATATLTEGHIMLSEVDHLECQEDMPRRLQEGAEASRKKEESQYISQMESLRYHLQNMLSVNNPGTSHGTLIDKREDDRSDSTSTLLNQRPLSPALSLSGLEALFPRYSTLYNAAPSLPDLQLRDALERETTRRKHLERHIQNLQNEMLELQQRLTVSVTADRRKDTMIQQLDQTLAVVVGGWKQQEKKREEMVMQLQEEKQETERARLRDQEVLVEVRQELTQALEALAKVEQTAAEEQRVLQSQVDEKTMLVTKLQAEREIEEKTLVEERREMEILKLQIAKQLNDWESRERELQEQCEKLQEEKRREVENERALAQQEYQKCQELQLALSSLQGDIVRLERDLQTSHREIDTLQMELNLEKARSESERVRIESEHKIRLEEVITEKVSAVHEESARHLCAVREQHRRQLLELTSQHERELSSQLSDFKTDLQERERRHKDAIMEYELKLSHSEDRTRELSAALRRLESERAEMLIQLQEVMKSHWSQALRVLSAKTFSESSDICPSLAVPLQTSLCKDSETQWRPYLLNKSGKQEEAKDQEGHSMGAVNLFKNNTTGTVQETSSSQAMDGSHIKNGSSRSLLGGSRLGDSRSQHLEESSCESQQMMGSRHVTECDSLDPLKHNQTVENRSQYLIGSSPLNDTHFTFLGSDPFRSQNMLGNSGSDQQVLSRSQSILDTSQIKAETSQLFGVKGKSLIKRDNLVQNATIKSHSDETTNQSIIDNQQRRTPSQNIFHTDYMKRFNQPLNFMETGDFEGFGNRPIRTCNTQSVVNSQLTSQPRLETDIKHNDFHSAVDLTLFSKISSQLGLVNSQKDSGHTWATQRNVEGPISKHSVQGSNWQQSMNYGHREERTHQPRVQVTDPEEDFYPMQMEELSQSFSSHMGFYPLEPIPDRATIGTVSETSTQISPEHPFQEEPSSKYGKSNVRSLETPQNMNANTEQLSPNPLLQYYIRMLLDRTPGDPFSDELESKSSETHPDASYPNTDMAELCQFLQNRTNQQPRSDDNPPKKPVPKVHGAVKKEVLPSQRRPAQAKVIKRVSARGGRPGVWK
ncbi:centrobin [Pelobates fuscus]|uniref:centrobin n=1 Tax=Pelobates fuscus TaxID=191477 RepID=UPI002FE42C9C